MKDPIPVFQKTLLAMLVGSLSATSAFAFSPDRYSYQEKTFSVDGAEMVRLRSYDQDQSIKFSADDLGTDEDESLKAARSFNGNDATNVQTAMRYVKAVFGPPSKTPVVETFTDKEDQASFGSPIAGKGISGTRLSTWFIEGKKRDGNLPIGLLTIGELGNKGMGTLKPLVAEGEGANMPSVIVHEMMHGLGISTDVDSNDEGKTFFVPENNSLFSTHVRDLYGKPLKPGMQFKKVSAVHYQLSETDMNGDLLEDDDKIKAKIADNNFYQLDQDNQSGAYFTGQNVLKVLTVDGKKAKIALADGASGPGIPGIPVNGYEYNQDDDGKVFYMPELSHLELQNSMMSHQSYRNWGTFMEAELAVLQDIGYDQIDRRRFFGFSIYNSGLTYTNNNPYYERNGNGSGWQTGQYSTQDWGVGLHVNGSKNTITQKADLLTKGMDAYGIRIDGEKNALTVAKGTRVHANGTDGIGILVSYGNGHSLNIKGDVQATGKNGNALRFDFGGNLLGDQEEYRGSYFRISQDKDTKKWEDESDGLPDALKGPLVSQVDISGSLKGNGAAIYISDNALVKQVNVLNGASIEGDIISDWSPEKNRYGEYGENMTLHIPENEEDGLTYVTFGLKADEDGLATEDADPDFKMTYNGNIKGESVDVEVKGGTLTYGGSADINLLETDEGATLSPAGKSAVAAAGITSNGTVSMSGDSAIILDGDKGKASFARLETTAGANATVDAGNGTVAITTMDNEGQTLFKSASAQKKQIVIDTYKGAEGSSLTLDLDSAIANRLKSGNTAETVRQGSEVLSIGNNTAQSNWNLHIAEGEINGDINAVIGPDGLPVSTHEQKNSTAAVLHDIAANNFQVFRAQINDLDKRMGDLRNMPGESGVWTKVIAGQSKYKGMHNDYKTLQLGIDHRFGDFFGGVTAAYTDGDGSVKHGSTDDKNYTFGLYGGWFGKDGQFVDVTLKHHHLESDYDFNANSKRTKGSYDTSGISFSVEYGWRLGLADTGYYIEPQAEFLYGHLNSTGYTTNRGVKVDQSSIKSAVGRLGVAAGWASPDKAGNVYVKASVLNDWEADSVVRTSKDGVKRRYHEDMGGTWGEFAVGGTWNINKRLSAYGEMETTAGSPVRTTYQFNAGLRVNF